MKLSVNVHCGGRKSGRMLAINKSTTKATKATNSVKKALYI